MIATSAFFLLLLFNPDSSMANRRSAPTFVFKSPDTIVQLEQRKATAENIKDDKVKVNTFLALAQEADRLGDKDKGLVFLLQAKRAAENIKDDKVKAEAFQTLAKAAAALGDKAKGLAFLEQVKMATENIKENQDKAESYIENPIKLETPPPCQFQPNAGPEMVLIAEGQFKMGSPENEPNRSNDESPQHDVTILKPFSISRCEVTIAEFKRFVEANDYKSDAEKGKGCYVWDTKINDWNQKNGTSWRNPGYIQEDNHPVACVSWIDVNKYIQWLNDSLKLTDKPYRLPSEAEWEYAARAGTTIPDYWGNDTQCEYSNGADSALKDNKQFSANWPYSNCTDNFVNTAPVGNFKPNAWGLYDMSGNLWEWVEDCWHDSYKGAPNNGSVWQADKGECILRLVRGGAWGSVPSLLRSAYRGKSSPSGTGGNRGFRLARTL